MKIDIHIIRTTPAANMNADESGLPKSVVFGGTRRASWSGQSQKHAILKSETFQDSIDDSFACVRTRSLPMLIKAELTQDGVNGEVIEHIITLITGKKTEEKLKTDIFLSKKELRLIKEGIKALVAGKSKAKALKVKQDEVLAVFDEATKTPNGVEIALQGRFSPNGEIPEVEACVSVAAAMAVNELEEWTDFVSVKDDFNSVGSAYLGEKVFSANTFYQFYSLDVDALKANLKGHKNKDQMVKTVLQAFLKATIYHAPTGNKANLASFTMPSAVVVCVKENAPSYQWVNAFETAISPGKETVAAQAIKRLLAAADEEENIFGIHANRFALIPGHKKKQTGVKMCENVDALVKAITDN